MLVLIGSDSSTCTSVTTITGTASATNASTSSTLGVCVGDYSMEGGRTPCCRNECREKVSPHQYLVVFHCPSCFEHLFPLGILGKTCP